MSYESIAVYMMANDRNGTIYIGVTSNLIQRAYQHRTHALDGFTKRYHIDKLVWYELHETMETAIHRESRLKKYTRAKKLALIESSNPEWNDLWETITQ